MLKNVSVFFLICLVFGKASAEIVYRGGAEVLNPKAYAISSAISYFNTSGHWDQEGNEVPLADGDSYHLLDLDLKLSYGFSDRIETSLFAKFRKVDSNDGVTAVNNSGPESAGVEFKYSLPPTDNLRYAVGLRYRQTLYTNTKYSIGQSFPTDQIVLGDDGHEYGIDLYATYKNRPWIVDLMGGYNQPPNDLSSEIIYKAQAHYQFTKLGLFAGVDGIHSLKQDQYTDAYYNKPIILTGKTYLFNSVNREKVEPYIGADLSTSKFLISLAGKTVMSGNSTDKGSTILFSLSTNTQGITPEAIKIESFKEYHIEGSVLKISARGNFVKIDQGLSTDVEKGMKFDIYQTDYFGGNELVASGIVYQIGSDWAVIKLVKKYKDTEIKPGFAARGY